MPTEVMAHPMMADLLIGLRIWSCRECGRLALPAPSEQSEATDAGG